MFTMIFFEIKGLKFLKPNFLINNSNDFNKNIIPKSLIFTQETFNLGIIQQQLGIDEGYLNTLKFSVQKIKIGK